MKQRGDNVARSTVVRISRLLLTCLLLLPELLLAQARVDSLRMQLREPLSDSLQIETMIRLSRELQRAGAQEEEDIAVATEAVDLATGMDTLLYARALNNLGLLYRYRQLYREASTLHQRAYTLIAGREGQTLDKMIFANNTGVAARYMADYDLAADYYFKALRIAEEEHNVRNIEIACNGIGNTFMAIPGREQEGLAYLERALVAAREADNKRGMAIQSLTIGSYHDQLGAYEEARRYYADLLEINIEISDEKGRGMALKAFGESYLKEGKNLDLSAQYFQDALVIFQQIDERQQQASTLLELGLLEMRKAAYPESIAFLQRAMHISESQRDWALIRAVSESLSQVYEATNRYAQALQFHKQARDYQDSINLSNQQVQIAAINSRYNFEKKEGEIELLKAEQSIHIAQKRTRGVIIALLIVLSSTLALLFFLQRRNRIHKQKTNERLTQMERERLEAVYEKNLAEAEILASQMRINPHFLFNCFNAVKSLIQQGKNEEAGKYLVSLSRFSRLVLETANRPVHTLEEELALVQYYIKVEKVRFSNDFCFTIDNTLGELTSGVELPSLLLQPFVENAIWHGLLPSNKETKMLSIVIEQGQNSVNIRIDDTGVGRQQAKTSPKQHKSRGTEINDKRITLFNKHHDTKISYHYIDKKDDQRRALGTCVVIEIKNVLHHEHSHS